MRAIDLRRNDYFIQGYVDKYIYIGLDSELSLSRGGTPVYPHQLGVPQERPEQLYLGEWAGKGGHYDWHGDGFAWELCLHPDMCIEVMCTRTNMALNFIEDKVGAAAFPTVYQVSQDVLEVAPREATQLGCAASFNVYGDPAAPKRLRNGLRTTGCHLHFSHPWLTPDHSRVAIRWCDVLAGTVWTMISPVERKVEVFRRKAYGKAGEHRLKIYDEKREIQGFEYRTLPGTVLASPMYLSLMYSLCREAIRQARSEGEPDRKINEAAVIAINTADKKLAQEVFFSLPLANNARKIITHYVQNPTPTVWGDNYQYRLFVNEYERATQDYI